MRSDSLPPSILDRDGPALNLRAVYSSVEYQLITLSPLKRRIVYVSIFELLGIVFATLVFMALSGGDAQQSLPVAVIVSTAAVAWNFV